MSNPASDWAVSAAGALARIDFARRVPFAEVLTHGTLMAGYYAPRTDDHQQPHTRDEVYIVVTGSGEFVRGDERVSFIPGDLLFVPAHMPHRFDNFSDDFGCWVMFWGPEGGEAE
jgi:oxalate decarboxylase/phosphoglucose isomerase-like protein (cupin superfamily)